MTTRTSRVNVDVTASTDKLESGMARANRVMNKFAQDTARLREQSEKINQLGTGLVGGAVGLSLLRAPFTLPMQAIETLAGGGKDALKAIENWRTKGTSLTSQGFDPVNAFRLAGNSARYDELLARVTHAPKSFLAEADVGGQGSYLDNWMHGYQAFMGGAGAWFNASWRQVFDQAPGKDIKEQDKWIRDVTFYAGMGAAADSDEESRYWATKRAAIDPVFAESFKSIQKSLNREQ